MKPNVKKLLIAMAELEMTTNELCISTGISQSTISKFKSGKNCKPEMFGKIAKALNVTVEELIQD